MRKASRLVEVVLACSLMVLSLTIEGCKIFGMDCGGEAGISSGSGGTTASGTLKCTDGGIPVRAVARAPSSRMISEGAGQQVSAGDFSVFRITSISIRDPHVLAEQGGICLDVTGLLNNDLNDRLSGDSDGDGRIDAGALLIFRGLTLGGPANSFQLVSASCNTLANTTCVPDDTLNSEINVLYTYTQNAANPCITPSPTHLKPYFPAVATPTQPCFATSSFDVDITFGSAKFPMIASRIAGRFVGNPPTEIVDGLMLAFLPESAANLALLPTAIPLVGGSVLSSILPGGSGNCAGWSDRDTGPDGVAHGWWFYANFTAERVEANLLSVPIVVQPLDLHMWAYPNPFRPHVTLSYRLPNSGHAFVEIVDSSGRRIATLVSADLAPGWHQVRWEGRDASGAQAPPGVYFARVRADGALGSQPIVLLK